MRALACGAPHTPGGSAGLRALLARTERKSRGEGGECHDRRVGNLGEPERAEGGAVDRGDDEGLGGARCDVLGLLKEVSVLPEEILQVRLVEGLRARC